MDKRIILTAIIATSLLHFKNYLEGNPSLKTDAVESPTRLQSKIAYETDPLIRMFTDGIVNAIYEWENLIFDKEFRKNGCRWNNKSK